MFPRRHYIQSLLKQDSAGRYRYYLDACEKLYDVRGMYMPSFIVPPDTINGGIFIPTLDPERTVPVLTHIPASDKYSKMTLSDDEGNKILFSLFNEQYVVERVSSHSGYTTHFKTASKYKFPRIFVTPYFKNGTTTANILYLIGFQIHTTDTKSAMQNNDFNFSTPTLKFYQNISGGATNGNVYRYDNASIHVVSYPQPNPWIVLACDSDIFWIGFTTDPISIAPTWYKALINVNTILFFSMLFYVISSGTVNYIVNESSWQPDL